MDRSSELAPINLVELRDGRDRAEALISTRFAEGVIDQDELERRLEAVHNAGTMLELERLIADLVEPGSPPGAALMRPSSAASVALVPLEHIPAERRIVATFGSIEQRGRWMPARRNRVIEVFGAVVLDLREAILGPGQTVFHVRCMCASLEVIVPPNLAVRVDVRVVFAAVERDREIPSDPLEPGDPVVVITGTLLLASLELKERLPGESARDARRRHREQRKAKRKAKRRTKRS